MAGTKPNLASEGAEMSGHWLLLPVVVVGLNK
jgi:hypothetical protein